MNINKKTYDRLLDYITSYLTNNELKSDDAGYACPDGKSFEDCGNDPDPYVCKACWTTAIVKGMEQQP